ncbi:N-acetyl-beta-glucosaminyl-glycoprotein 4-beta-N-acetylgalactosaminyltransferase [Desmophyllum pertusum]|uniref:N-acetyl-beta-glucosaminyl-glycoprotein 4-beta-N-acetylgalactosaminyltransferase n=1 Tax=Desmophyllum pertusum TaxID=174260 RepID=A0A9W9YW26_9CNID|nr:N-acetyl-beta-glucosaminyl-glycoprotein 4-beta-N-acetylgalactosaminyltransferase [Desmophyllum pertusum]
MGALNVHIWRDLCGSNIPSLQQSLFFPHYPDESLKKFIAEFQIEDNTEDYGQQTFGFVHTPDSSGSYRFAIASDDESELWLSTSEDPNEKQLIARVFMEGEYAWTEVNEFNKYPDQISKELKLREGSKYYIEVLHKQGVHRGFVQVYWKRSEDADFKVINSKYLSSYSDNILVTTRRDALHNVLSNRHRHDIEMKSKTTNSEYLQFYSLPLFPKDNYLPSCDYKTSSVLNGRVYRYEGLQMVNDSSVFPADDTSMDTELSYEMTWPNRVANMSTIQVLVDKIITSLQLKTSNHITVHPLEKCNPITIFNPLNNPTSEQSNPFEQSNPRTVQPFGTIQSRTVQSFGTIQSQNSATLWNIPIPEQCNPLEQSTPRTMQPFVTIQSPNSATLWNNPIPEQCNPLEQSNPRTVQPFGTIQSQNSATFWNNTIPEQCNPLEQSNPEQGNPLEQSNPRTVQPFGTIQSQNRATLWNNPIPEQCNPLDQSNPRTVQPFGTIQSHNSATLWNNPIPEQCDPLEQSNPRTMQPFGTIQSQNSATLWNNPIPEQCNPLEQSNPKTMQPLEQSNPIPEQCNPLEQSNPRTVQPIGTMYPQNNATLWK